MSEYVQPALLYSKQETEQMTAANKRLLKSSEEASGSLSGLSDGLTFLGEYLSDLAGNYSTSEGGMEEGLKGKGITQFMLKGAQIGFGIGGYVGGAIGLGIGGIAGDGISNININQNRDNVYSSLIKQKTDGQRLGLENTLSGASDLAAQQEELEWIESALAQKSLIMGEEGSESELRITEEDKAIYGYSETLMGKLEKLNTLKGEAQLAMGRAFNEKIEPQIDAEIQYYEDNQEIIQQTSERIGAYFGEKAQKDSENRLSLLQDTYDNISDLGIKDEELWPMLASAGLQNEVFSLKSGLGFALEGNDDSFRTKARDLLKGGDYRLFGYDRMLEESKGLHIGEAGELNIGLGEVMTLAALNEPGGGGMMLRSYYEKMLTEQYPGYSCTEKDGVLSISQIVEPAAIEVNTIQPQNGVPEMEEKVMGAYIANSAPAATGNTPSVPPAPVTNNNVSLSVSVHSPILKEDADVEGVANTVAQRILRALQLSGQPFIVHSGPI